MSSSDPYAWLRPYFATLRLHSAFPTFAPAIQFDQLVQAVEREHASKAAELREWSPVAQTALLMHLASMHDRPDQTATPFEFWEVRKAERRLRCVCVFLESGVDLRLFEGADFRRTQLCKDTQEAQTLADAWLAALIDVGWTTH